jgi:hypothetical protein
VVVVVDTMVPVTGSQPLEGLLEVPAATRELFRGWRAHQDKETREVDQTTTAARVVVVAQAVLLATALVLVVLVA